MIEITLEGLNPTQRVLADIIWTFEEKREIDRFIRSLPEQYQQDAEGIFQLMLMAAIEQHYEGIQDMSEAQKVVDKVRR